MDVSALILAGGKATRLGGVAKHLLVVGGETIFARQVRVLAPRVDEILVSAPARVERDGAPAEDAISGYRTVHDAVAGAGPLAGILAGLGACTTPWLLVVAGDMPYLDGGLLDRMIGMAAGDVDAVGVRAGGLPEPLVCLLHVRVRPVIERRLAAGRYKASGLLTDEGLMVRWVDDPPPGALRNVNSPEDL